MARTSNTRPVVQRRSPGREDSDDDESYFESEDDEPVVDASDAGGVQAPSKEPRMGFRAMKATPIWLSLLMARARRYKQSRSLV